jgi:mannose-1-phosphate guanylyltransferase
MLHAMIMAGGGGTRFWPRSRTARPKQFLAMSGERTLLQMALDRLEACGLPPQRSWILTGQAYLEETARQLPGLPASHIVGEPTGRDTAPCVGLGAALIAREDPDAVILVTPADHVIEPLREFARAVHAAEALAVELPGSLVTFGIAPTFPSTGYGYIHRGASLGARNGVNAYRVARFEEKPPLEKAERFAASGEHYWNSGIFVWRAKAILDALARNTPELHAAVCRIADHPEELARLYPTLTKVSIDYAVMEKHPEVLVVEAPYRWDDVGSWLALERMSPQDGSGNTVQGNHVGVRTERCIIIGSGSGVIGTVGVKDLVIVQDGDCTLVAHRDDEGAVKQLVEEARRRGLERFL